MTAVIRRAPVGYTGLLTVAFVALPLALSAQTLTISTAGDVLRVHARDFAVLVGPVLNRLKEGQSVQIDFELALLTQPDGPVVKQVAHGFTLSFDLWEERFAVSRAGSPPRSISHLRARDAEDWCLDNVTLPISSLGIGRGTPFWLRLAYRVQGTPPVVDDPGERYTLRALIDRLSRRRDEGDLSKAVSGGPFRFSD